MPPEVDDAGIEPAGLDRLAVIMSQVDGTDFERVDPPEGLWGRIAATISLLRSPMAASTSNSPLKPPSFNRSRPTLGVPVVAASTTALLK